ncbi:unnamed protein product, partial [Rotaria sp. Silwood2]
ISITTSAVKAPKRLGYYHAWPSTVQGARGNITAAIATFSQFDLLVFGNDLANVWHNDHNNTRTIISSLNVMGKSVYGYIDMGVTTKNLSISEMKKIVDDWAKIGAKGIMWAYADYGYGVTCIRQATMISYCHSSNMSVMMHAWNPDDVFHCQPMLLDSRDIYLLAPYLISNGNYQNLKDWKIKADQCQNYSARFGVSMACVATSTADISLSFGTSQQFSQAWFGTAMYNFDYFQATDHYYSAKNSVLYAFPNPIWFYGNFWKTNHVQMDTPTHYYRSTDTHVLHMYSDCFSYGSGNLSVLSNE